MANSTGPDFPYDNTKAIECQATFKNHCQWPKCDCDRIAKCVTAETINTIDLSRRPALEEYLKSLDTDDNQVGACHLLWLINGGETSEWNGDSCDCKYVQGNLNCKLNPF